jgi:glyoxylase-like metal-dependent hydrolase (beta-lactamase superfamily II)
VAEAELPEIEQGTSGWLGAPPMRPFTCDQLLAGGETLNLASLEIEAIAAPGHRPGHLVFAVGGRLFAGDVLFQGSVGRTDLPGGDWDELMQTLEMLTERFGPETIVYPGHGPETTLGLELRTNPFLSELRAR